MTRALRTVVVALLLAGVASGAAQKRREPDAPFVETPDEVVTAMLKMANVTKDDVVYDLGSGDGRIVIAAAKQFGARGVGVEIKPSLVKQSREAAEAAGVADRVTILEQDLFETSVKDATVLTLYLGREINLKLKPRILQELKPGSRIVSHNFDMGDDWPPLQTQVLAEDSTIYLWVVPEKK